MVELNIYEENLNRLMKVAIWLLKRIEIRIKRMNQERYVMNER
jgi:hypothetical protein